MQLAREDKHWNRSERCCVFCSLRELVLIASSCMNVCLQCVIESRRKHRSAPKLIRVLITDNRSSSTFLNTFEKSEDPLIKTMTRSKRMQNTGMFILRKLKIACQLSSLGCMMSLLFLTRARVRAYDVCISIKGDKQII